MEPAQKKGRSRQDHGTPWDFIRACEARFGALAWDLSASAENAKAPNRFTREDDTFTKDWSALSGTSWLNPEFADLDPYMAKCAAECQHRQAFTLVLTPASIGCGWFDRHVLGKAFVLGLSPRIVFEGSTAPYPKDLMLSVYGFGLSGFDTWRWKR